MTEKLKSCPFCGGTPVMLCTAFVECSCTAYGPDATTKTEAVAAWNRRADGWIPVTERLPEDSGHMLIFESGLIQKAHYEATNGIWIVPHLIGYRRETVTHWQPLPAAPKDGDA